MPTPRDRVVQLLERDLLMHDEGSSNYIALRSVLFDLQEGVEGPVTLAFLRERSLYWFGLAMNAPSDALRDSAAGLEPSNHSFLYEQTADDFEVVGRWLQRKGTLQEACAE